MFSADWFFDLEKTLRERGLDSDDKSFDEIRDTLSNPKKLSPTEFASAVSYVILASGFNQNTAKKIHKIIMPLMNQNPTIDDLKKFFHDALNAVNINRLENHLVIGFSNFAKTGEYIGYIWAILSILMGTLPNSRLSAEPSFNGEVLNLKGYLNIDINILKLIIPIIKLILKKEIQELIKGVLNG